MPDPIVSPAPSRTRRPVLETPPPPRLRPRRSRLLLVGLPMFAVFAAFAAIVWMAYEDGAYGPPVGEPPLIKAAATPLKLEPGDPGGRVVADQGEVRELLSEEPDEPAPERLLPPPEQPLSPPGALDVGDATAAVDPERANGPAGIGREPAGSQPAAIARAEDPPPATPAPRTTPERATEPAVAEPETSPRQVEDEAVAGQAEAALQALLSEVTGPAEPAQQDASPAVPDTASEPPAERETRPAQAQREVRPAIAVPAPQPPSPAPPTRPESESNVAAIAPGEPVEPAPSAREPAPGAREPAASEREPAPIAREPATTAPEPAPQPAQTAARPDPLNDRYRIQLAAVRAEPDARRAWDLFMIDLGPVLSELQPFFERAETSNGVFYRVQAGPFASLDAAESVCTELKQRNASCFVVRR